MQLNPSLQDSVYTAYHGLLRRLAPRRRDILVWPPVESAEQLDDLLPRLQFYFAETEPGVRVVVLRNDSSIKPTSRRPYYLDSYGDRCTTPIVLATTRKSMSLAGLVTKYRGVVLTRPATSFGGGKWLQYFPNVTPLDPKDVEMPAFWASKIQHQSRKPEMRRSQRVLRDFVRGLPKRRKAYLLCTGPSLSRFREFDFSDGYVIGCNSVVSNDPLMEHAKPHFIVACDPIFHFGPSIYAEKFRQDLAAAARRFPFLYLTLDVYQYLMQPHFDLPGGRTCLVPRTLDLTIKPLTRRWAVPQTANIMTMFMMPLAHTIADDLYIIGADGREPGETYFWKHDPSSQLTDKMQAIKDCHPAFFEKRNYVDYYDTHCDVVQRWVDQIESTGGHVYTLTQSHIPALAARNA